MPKYIGRDDIFIFVSGMHLTMGVRNRLAHTDIATER